MARAGGQLESMLKAGLVLAAMLMVTACGSNDGTFVERSTVAVTGTVTAGADNGPLANASCRVVDLDGRVRDSATADAAGAFLLLVEPGENGFIVCAPRGQTALELRGFVSTVGLPEGGELSDQRVSPETTVFGRLVAQEFGDDQNLDPVARRDELATMLGTDADLTLLTEAAALLFDRVRGGANADFEALLQDLVDDSTLDAPAFAEVAEEIDAAVAELEAARGRSLADAFLARFPAFNLSLLHHSGADSALLDAGAGLEDFGGVARFAAVVAAERFAAANFGAVVLVSAGNQIAPGLLLQPSIDDPDVFFDAAALGRLEYDVLALGSNDLLLGPGLLADFLLALEPAVPMVASTLDVSAEPNFTDLVNDGRLRSALLFESRARRIGILSALRSDLARVASPRGLVVASADQLLGAVQAQVDGLAAQGARVIILLSQQADLAADLALAEQLAGVDVVVAAGDDSLLAMPDALLVPGDEARVAGEYPLFVTDAADREIPVVSTAGRYRYLGRLDASFDPLGRLIGVDMLNSRPVRVAGVGTPDGVNPDADMAAEVIVPLQEAIVELEETTAATSDVQLDARSERVSRAETNFGNLLADAVFAVARAQGPGFGAPGATVAIVDAGSITADAVLPADIINRADSFDLVDPDVLLSVIANVSAGALKQLIEHGLADDGSPAFLQMSNLVLEWDPDGTAQLQDADGEVVTPGTRVRQLSIAGGPTLVEDGEVPDGAPSLSVATTDRVARGLSGHPPVGGARTNLALALPQVFNRFITEGLRGNIAAGDFPEGGTGRIVRLGPES